MAAVGRLTMSGTVAVVVFLLVGVVSYVTSGIGGLTTACVATVWLVVWRQRSAGTRTQMVRQFPVWTTVGAMAITTVAWNTVSAVRYLASYNGDSIPQKMATWGRDHGLSPIIDVLEDQVYSEPPSRAPASALPIAVPVASTTTTVPSTPSTATSDSASPQATVESTTTTLAPPLSPPPLPVVIAPALPGEGEWVPVAQAAGRDAMWVTSVRPLAEFGSVTATVVVVDPTHLRAAMFNGRELPGGEWIRDDHVPPDLVPALVAAMNGGFRPEHTYGGYVTEGRVVKPLENGWGTVGIGRDGRMVIGELGRDLIDDGSWQSLRQNGMLLVDGGVSQTERARREGVFWGSDGTGDLFVNRSAVCALTSGRIAYVMAGKVDPSQMADVLIGAGCQRAVQLDINGQWPNFTVFAETPDGAATGFVVDRRMHNDPLKYLRVASKEFFAFFDATKTPTVSALDF